ncbi:MAG: SpoIIE family protein phosphatase [Firmicutes bacterium]|nr:SpoIIE family protein phosphatase [Bacillota bacterium]MDD4263786.1 SpoIIE family protein phosphatase [Bacillota bacterium]MDD4693776.1 SpoIIE family protein phosphatase [Bacillota bacterium]
MGVVATHENVSYKRIGRTSSLENVLYSTKTGLKHFGLAFLAAISIPGVYGVTFGILAYIYSWSLANKRSLPEARCTMLGGLIGILIYSFSLYCFMYWIFLWVFMEIFMLKAKPLYKNIKTLTIFPSLLYPVLIIIGKSLAFPLLTYIVYALLCGVLQFNNYRTFDILEDRDRVWESEECISILMAAILLGTSFYSVSYFGVSVGKVIMWLIVAASGMLGGPLWGVVAATLVAFSGQLLRYGHYLILLGAFSGVISMLKGYSLLLFILTVLVVVMDRNLHQIGAEMFLAEICLPFLLKKVQPLKFSIPAFTPQEKTESKALELKARIAKFSETLEELSKVFSGIPIENDEEKESVLPCLVEAIAAKVCNNCGQKESCWQRGFYTTYTNMFNLLVELEGELSSEALYEKSRNWCSQPKELADSALSLLKMRGLDIVWQKRLIESKGVVANQLKGLANVVSDLGCQLDLLQKDKHCSEVSSFELKRRGIDFNSIECSRFEHGVAVTLSVPKRSGHCLVKEVRKIISNVTGQDCIVEKHICKEDFCELYLVPRYIYDVNAFIRRRPAEGYTLCGDSCEVASLGKGRHLAVLSDGMGVGPEAAIQSSTVVSFIEKFTSLDVPSNETLKLVNSLSYLSNEEETFATVDLVLLDKYTGEVRLSKLGSALSFVKRGRRVETVSSSSLPVGMLSSVNIIEKMCQFRPKDLLVILSDGVITQGCKVTKDSKWLETLLISTEGSAEVIGDKIFSKLPHDNQDDLTVMVLELKLV